MTKYNFFALIKDHFLSFLSNGMQNLIHIGHEKAFSPAGHNGPHLALESPVRNSCHWLLAFTVGYRLDANPDYARAAKSLFNWLTQGCPYFASNGFINRQKHGHDWCNGVIGSAWIIEALCRADGIPGISGSADFAKQYYQRHAFSRANGAWHRFDPHTQRFGIDSTLNHQAWFAAAAADAGFVADANEFLSACERGGFRLRKDGRIRHLFYTSDVKARLLSLLFGLKSLTAADAIRELELAYHHYTLLPFARLAKQLPDHPFWRSAAFEHALSFMDTKWIVDLEGNKYGWPYNAPGFELPLLLERFDNRINLGWNHMKNIFERQLNLIDGSDDSWQSFGVPDLMTLSARIYELSLFVESMLDEGQTLPHITTSRKVS